MSEDIVRLHHVGHVVRDMAAALDRYRRMGFRVPPPSYPTLSGPDGGPPTPVGAGNTHADFRRNFIELVAVVDEQSGPPPGDVRLVPLQAPPERLADVTAAIRGTVAGLATCLQRFEGTHILMFHTDDADRTAARLDDYGVRHGGTKRLQRPVDTAAGERMAPIGYLEIDDDSSPTPGLVREGRVGVAENPADAVLDRQRGLDHPNGAVGLVECVLCVEDGDLAGTATRYGRYLGRTARVTGDTAVFELGGATLTIHTPAALERRFPGEKPAELPGFAAYGVEVLDIGAAERLLRENGVPVERSSFGEPYVPSHAASGTAIVFR